MTEPDFLTATRTSYDTIAADYAELFRDELANMPLDRALFAGFAEIVKSADLGPVADIGCGPGWVTALLDSLGVPVFGLDLSPGMIALAQQDYPGLRFEVGSMTALDLDDSSLGGIVSYYSTIHIPLDRLPEVFAEFHRVLAPGGQLMVVFQVGDEPVEYTEAFDKPVALSFHRRRPEPIAELMSQAGLEVWARLVREPSPKEKTQQALLLASKPS